MAVVDERPFSSELLLKPKSELMKYFKDTFVPHEKAKAVLKLLISSLCEPAGTSLFLLFGCTGSGKSMLLKQLHKQINELFKHELINDPGKIVSANMEVPEQPGRFNYKDYYWRGLEALHEVLIEYKVYYPTLASEEDAELIVTPSERNAAGYRRALENTLKNRKLVFFSLDEAQHALMAANSGQMLRQFNWIKSMANISKTTHLLCGTYELLNCRTWNGQTGRRSEDIHLERYHADVKEDYAEIVRVIKTLLRRMPVQNEPDTSKFARKYDYIIEYCIGCVGVLKDWFHRALRRALDDGATTLLLKHLKQTELSPVRRKQIRDEAERGEQILRDEVSGSPAATNLTATQSRNSSNKGRKDSTRPGERLPNRDTVGTDQFAAEAMDEKGSSREEQE
ncbi:AAA family ATPase [Leptolyngbya ohadii]|uniref:AAA family ATPase n=1 Tax=Leptolyngbya ohadii TaxID=1962290 RepID=UPI000B599C21|nr:AAA family ATPase [Leptolyngbya ohadii]